MILSKDEIKNITTGYVYAKDTENGVEFFRFSENQEKLFNETNKYFAGDPFFVGYFGRNCHTGASIKFDFYTDAKKILVKIGGNEQPNDTETMQFDVYVDSKMLYQFDADKDFEFEVCGKRPKKRRVTIYFPYFNNPIIKGIDIEGNFMLPVNSYKKVDILAIGDSITHGVGSKKTSVTWINTMSRKLDVAILNQANSGYVYDSKTIEHLCEPRLIILAYGINDQGRKNRDELEKDTREYIDALKKAYPKVQIAAVSPLWVESEVNNGDNGFTNETRRILSKVYEEGNVFVINGLKMMPNSNKYLSDSVHPNTLGHTYYGNRMAKEILNLLKKQGSN